MKSPSTSSGQAKTCQNCRKNFTIDPEDFDFYEKIKVPPPTWCPQCRMQRRFTFRNELSLHKNKCALTGNEVISCFAPDSGITVYDRDVWWSDDWDPMQYGQEYNFNEPFFKQFRGLMEKVPMPAVFNGLSVNSNYCNHVGQMKNGYLVSASWIIEDTAYSNVTSVIKNSFDLFVVNSSELCYEDVASLKLYQTFFSENSEGCNNSAFLYDCKGCSYCFGCTNLRNKQYYIFNQPYTKEEYFKKLQDFDIGSYANLVKVKKKFEDLKIRALRKFASIIKSKDSTGDNLSETTNCKHCFRLWGDIRDCKFVINGGHKMNDAYDCYGAGGIADLLYESVDIGVEGARLAFGFVLWGGHDVQYSFNCHNCENCFGCVGLRKKSYCIFNKQYSKQQYEELLPRIIKQMNDLPYFDNARRVYRYGEFFPTEISPFVYNETIAQDYFRLSREEIEKQGWRWREPEASLHVLTVKASDLPDNIKDIKDDILKAVIGCGDCGRAFRLIKSELDFLRRFNIALPRRCFACRHQNRFKQVNLPKLYHRQCMCLAVGAPASPAKQGESAKKADYKIHQNTTKHNHHPEGRCPNEFETTYAPDRKEVVYCESCYNSEVV